MYGRGIVRRGTGETRAAIDQEIIEVGCVGASSCYCNCYCYWCASFSAYLVAVERLSILVSRSKQSGRCNGYLVDASSTIFRNTGSPNNNASTFPAMAGSERRPLTHLSAHTDTVGHVDIKSTRARGLSYCNMREQSMRFRSLQSDRASKRRRSRAATGSTSASNEADDEDDDENEDEDEAVLEAALASSKAHATARSLPRRATTLGASNPLPLLLLLLLLSLLLLLLLLLDEEGSTKASTSS